MAKKKEKTLEEKLQEALVPENQWPYILPENWCWTKGKYILEKMESQKPEGDYFYYIDIDAIDNSCQIVTEPKQIAVCDAPSRASRKLHVGDTIFSLVRPYLKNIAYIDKSLSNSIASTGFYVCTPKKNVFPKFFYWLMISPYVVDGLNKYMKGDNSPSIRGGDIEGFCYPIPPLPEQKRIVYRIESLFAKLDEAKEKIQQVLDGAEMRKAAILHKAFTGELTKNWRKENGISDDTWVTKKLCETEIDIIDGDRGKNYPKKDEFSNDGYCVFLNAKNVTKTGFQFENIQYITQEKDELLRKGKLKRGDIVLTTRGTIGNIALYDDSIPFDDMRINSGMVIYRYGESFYGPYIIWLYRSPFIIKQYSLLQTGSAQPQLPIKDMRNLQLSIPCIEEQKCIAKLLDDFAMINVNIVEKCNKVISDIDVMKKSILAKAFRGELGTNNPTEDSALNLLKEVLQDKS